MSGRGIVEGEIFRSELIEANARTSDPTNPAVGDWWIRSDVQPSVDGATTVGALRIQGSGGVLEVPFFDAAEVSNLGSDVYVGERFRFDDGTVGFIAETDQGGSLGSPRLVAPDGTEFQAHDALELSALPDSAVYRWKLDEGAGTSINADIGGVDGSISGSVWVSGDWQGGYALSHDGGDDYTEINGSNLLPDVGAVGLTFEATDLSNPFTLFHDGQAGADGTKMVWDGDSNLFIDIGNLSDFGGIGYTDYNFSTNTKYRILVKYDIPNKNTTWYVNTQNDTHDRTNGAGNDAGDYFYIGAKTPGNSHFPGVIDDFIIYSEQLTTDEVNSDYSAQPWS